jgi:dipeptidyl aminopeptidase/acylaminoacyl peptidase
MRKVLWCGLLGLLLLLGLAVAQETPQPTPLAPAAAPSASPAPAAAPSIEAYLQIKQAYDGHWLADGKAIVYKTNVSGTMQVWKVDAEGGAPTQLTFFDDPVDAVAPSPTDANLVLFSKAVGGNERTQMFLMNADGKNVERLAKNDEAIFNFGAWSRDGKRIAYASNARNPAFFDVYVMDLATRATRPAMQKDANLEAATFSPSGDRLIVSDVISNADNNLYLVDLAAAAAKPALLTPHAGWAVYDLVRWPVGPESAEGFFVVSNLMQEFKKLAFLRVKVDGLEYRETRGWDTDKFVFSRNGLTMAWADNVQGLSRVWVRDVKAKKALPSPKPPAAIVLGMELSPQGERLLLAAGDARSPADLYVADVKTGEVRRLTTSDRGALSTETFVAPEPIVFATSDNRGEPAFLYLPRELPPGETKAPCILSLHGGPEEQERPNFNPLYQYLLRRGYAIMAPNIRGSTGYGKSYSHLDDREKRPDAVRDVADAAKFIRKNIPRIDPDRIAAFGGSYGGYLTLAALTEYPDQFAAGVCIAGIANFETFLEKTGPWRRKNREAEYGSLEHDRELLRRISPIHRVDRLRAPLMLVYGKNDPRVPLAEAEQMYDALKKRGQPVELLVYADEGHGLRKLKNRLDAYPKIAAFLDRYLGAAPASPAEASPIPAPMH